MMKRIMMLHVTILLILLLFLLSSCASFSVESVTVTAVPGTEQNNPGTDTSDVAVSRSTVMLYFRYGSEPYLAAESRMLTFEPTAGREKTILTALLAGPGSNTRGLEPLFPSGTNVVSATMNGRTLFVTLTADVLNSLPDEPADWRDDPYWNREMPLRRELAMQSIVATVTENCKVDNVQIMLESSEQDTGSLRLPARYFRVDENSENLQGPMERNENLILSPSVTASVICRLRSERNWDSLYAYVADRDEETGQEKPNYKDFVMLMDQTPMITETGVSGGSIDQNGDHAVFTVHAEVVDGNRLRDPGTGIIKLCRENGLWKITMDQLTGWPEA